MYNVYEICKTIVRHQCNRTVVASYYIHHLFMHKVSPNIVLVEQFTLRVKAGARTTFIFFSVPHLNNPGT